MNPPEDSEEQLQRRRDMVRRQLAQPEDLRTPVRDSRVLDAMTEVPRHIFVPAEMLPLACADRPLPIRAGQTISQPYMVALATEQLALKPGARVLDVGTGSGYQAAVLAAMGAEVWSVEIVEELYLEARERLERLGYPVHTRRGDGYVGWPEAAPFDAITVACAAEQVPPALTRQLAPGGRLVIPVGSPHAWDQRLLRLEKQADGSLQEERLAAVRYVPMTRDDGGPA